MYQSFMAKQYSFIYIYIGEGNGIPLQYSCLENAMDGGAWWAAVHGVAKSRTWLRDITFTFLHWKGNGTPLQCSHITICLSLCWLADIWVVSCLLAIMNTAAMNVNVYFVCVWAYIFISLNCILRSRAAGFQPSFDTHNWEHWVCDSSLISLKHFPVTILDFLHFIHLIITEKLLQIR